MIIIGAPNDASAHLAYNRRFVYSLYAVDVLRVPKHKAISDHEVNSVVPVAELGGSIRFLSGHQEFFWEVHDGFTDLNKQYLLFLWKPVHSSDTYMTSEAYLLDGERVFPIMLSSGESRYSNMPADKLIDRVKALIASDKDGS